MRECPTCRRVYADNTHSFCLDDGTRLSAQNDPEATLVLDADDSTVRTTNPDYKPDKSVVTVLAQPQQTSPTVSTALPKAGSPHLIYAGAGLLAVIIVVGGLIYIMGNRTNDITTQLPSKTTPISNVPSNTPIPAPTVFRTEITVPSTEMWYDTGISVSAGSSVRVEYLSGQWTNVVGSNMVDGQGKQFDRRDLLIVPTSFLSALVGKVGNNSFHIGNAYFGKPGSGKLFLSMNDTNDHPGTYADNGGFLRVLVEINGSSSSTSNTSIRSSNIPTTRQLQDELLKEAKRIEDAANR